MPNILDLRRRIRSVRNMQQITRAMKMVATARLRRAQERVVNARPYADQILTVLRSVASRAEERSHPLLAVRPVRRTLLVLITADRGLCGAFNTNLIRAAQGYFNRHGSAQVDLLAVGRKGRDYFRKRGLALTGESVNLFGRLEFAHAEEIAQQIMDVYTREEVDGVDFIYNEFKSILRQNVKEERYLPLEPLELFQSTPIDYIYEQPPAEIFRALLPRYVEAQVYRALLESQAAELAAKMTAMDTATNNAAKMIDSLTLYMNRVRQATITKEIIEIVGGAAAQE